MATVLGGTGTTWAQDAPEQIPQVEGQGQMSSENSKKVPADPIWETRKGQAQAAKMVLTGAYQSKTMAATTGQTTTYVNNTTTVVPSTTKTKKLVEAADGTLRKNGIASQSNQQYKYNNIMLGIGQTKELVKKLTPAPAPSATPTAPVNLMVIAIQPENTVLAPAASSRASEEIQTKRTDTPMTILFTILGCLAAAGLIWLIILAIRKENAVDIISELAGNEGDANGPQRGYDCITVKAQNGSKVKAHRFRPQQPAVQPTAQPAINMNFGGYPPCAVQFNIQPGVPPITPTPPIPPVALPSPAAPTITQTAAGLPVIVTPTWAGAFPANAGGWLIDCTIVGTPYGGSAPMFVSIGGTLTLTIPLDIHVGDVIISRVALVGTTQGPWSPNSAPFAVS